MRYNRGMDSPEPTTTLTCTQCGGELHPDEGQVFVTCPFCGATVFVDRAQVVFHWYVAPTLDADQAAAALRRWMSGSSGRAPLARTHTKWRGSKGLRGR